MNRNPIVATFLFDQVTKDRIARMITYSRYKSATSFMQDAIGHLLQREVERSCYRPVRL